ncbi:conserved hypothetical protein [Vibrio chagasii]|nr:conserved hypothetical protein [Vibrio chagasii]CAH7145227.1 conserved hypothetical protein [Vibrio chagasii]
MQINEINELSRWYLKEIQGRKLDSLVGICTNRLKGNSNNLAATRSVFEKDKESLLKALSEIDRTPITINQRKCLIKLNVSSIVLEGAVDEFTLLFDMHVNDTNFVISTLERYLKFMTAAAKAFTQIQAALPTIVPTEFIDAIEVPPGKVLTRLTFHNDASIANVAEFHEWAKRWNFIARGFSMAVNQSAEDFEIVNADRGSFIIDLLVGAAAMKILFESLKSLTDLAVSVTELRIKHQELEKLKQTVPAEMFQQFSDASSQNIEKQESEIVDKVIANLKAQGLIETDKADNELAKAIKEVHKFNSYGGSMTCLASNDDQFDTETVKELNQSYKLLQSNSEVKLIEEKVVKD